MILSWLLPQSLYIGSWFWDLVLRDPVDKFLTQAKCIMKTVGYEQKINRCCWHKYICNAIWYIVNRKCKQLKQEKYFPTKMLVFENTSYDWSWGKQQRQITNDKNKAINSATNLINIKGKQIMICKNKDIFMLP